MIWSVLQMVSKQGLSFIVFAILSWLLSPADFGILATAMIMITFLDSFVENGFSSALIQKQNVTEKHFSSVFAVNLVVGTCLTTIGIFSAGLVAEFFAMPQLKLIIQVLSVSFVINAISLTQTALAQKKLQFRSLAIRDTISTLVGGSIGIALALLHFGIWSLVIQTIITYALSAIVLWVMTQWRPQWRLMSMSAIKELWPYSSRLFVFNFVKFFAQNTEKFVITLIIGSIALGVYTFAYKFTVLPITMFAGAIGIYLFPQFSRLQKDPTVAIRSYLTTTRVVQAIVTPIILATMVSAPIIIPLVWQNKWLDAIIILQALAALAYTQNLISPIGQLLKAFNKPGWLLAWSIGVTVILGAALPFAADRFQLVGVAWTMTIIYLIGLPVNYWLLQQVLPIRLTDIGRALSPSLFSSGLAAIVFLISTALVGEYPEVQLIVGFSLSATTYFSSLYWLDRPSILLILSAVKQLRHSTHVQPKISNPNPTTFD